MTAPLLTEQSLSMLRCPETRQPLRLIDAAQLTQLNDRIAARTLTNRSGTKLERALDGGLVRDDGQIVYPIIDRIPILLADEGIAL
jgi:uncharacterized protein YbaR (Trm112 family)